MNKFSKPAVATAVSMALALWAQQGVAQDKAPAEAAQPKDAKPAAPVQELETVLVVGTRQSQQSAIGRKKHAATAQDSIVAEDVGAFPDRNIGEAISRIAGVALDRGDYGEGVNVSIRGNGPELTRVELDGQTVRSGAGTDLLGGGDGRGAEFRELSSDLIKSVDVVKGSTAKMVEGSLGGGIIIETRTGLDFDKPYYSLRAAATQSDLNKKTTPNYNLVLADKFLDKRLGVLLNLNDSRYRNEVHQLTNGGANNQAGLLRPMDFDNSPQKTFTFQPQTLAGDTINTTLLASPLTAGGTFNAATPMELLTKSAAAQTKADCFSAFPNLTAAQTNAINGSSARTLAINQRSNEQLTCLNQWNDYIPALIRSYVRSQDDKRTGGDIRLDFKVNDQLSLYGKYSSNRRDVADIVGNFSVGGAPTINGAGTFADSAAGVRSVASGLAYPYYVNPNTYSFRSGATLSTGAVSNIKPGYTVDDSHHVTSYTTTDGFYSTDMIFSRVKTDSHYLQAGGEYKDGRVNVKAMIGTNDSSAFRFDRRATFSYQYGEGSFNVQPDGSWTFALPPGSTNDQLNYAKYAQLSPQTATAAVPVSATNTVAVPAYTSAQKPLLTPTTNLQVIRLFKSINDEKTGKLDFTLDLREQSNFFQNIQAGLNFRDTRGSYWGLGGATVRDPQGTFGTAGYVPGIYLPSVNTRSSVVGCENTAGSLGPGGQPCAYGYNPSTNPATPQNGQTVLSQAQYLDLVKQTLSVPPAGQFYAGAKNRAPGLIDGWNQIDIDKLFSMAGIPLNLDCVVSCKASDGQVYDQPVTRFQERAYATYLMTDFETDRVPFTNWQLPFGMELTGNIGVRIVQTEVAGTGQLTFQSIRKTAAFDPANPGAAGGTTTSFYRQNTSIKGSNTDVMPSLNLGLWVVPDKVVTRYSVGKTVARPPVSKLLPSGTCTYSEVVAQGASDPDGTDPDQRCSGTMGNPDLKPQTNINHNLSVEWFANRDTMLSAAVFRQHGLVGAPTLVSPRANTLVFQGTGVVDPATGKPLSDLQFAFNQWDNQQPSTRRGVELGMKTAFTFLPWLLRYTGVDANYTRVRSTQGVPTLDLVSGDVLPVINEPKYSYNASLWYDDGGFSARIATQVVAPRYQAFSPNTTNSIGVNNYPSIGTTSWRVPYNPGAPIFGSRTRFVDAKVSYRFKNGLEIFADVRNLTGERTQSDTGGYQGYSDGIPSLYIDAYSGRRYMVGMTLRSPR